MLRAARTVRCMAIALGLAATPAPFAAQAQGQRQPAVPNILPMNIADVRCHVLLRQRLDAYVADNRVATEERVKVVNNLIIISAFYAGRLSLYPADDAVDAYARARRDIARITSEQRDRVAQECASFYRNVTGSLDGYRQQQPARQGQ